MNAPEQRRTTHIQLKAALPITTIPRAGSTSLIRTLCHSTIRVHTGVHTSRASSNPLCTLQISAGVAVFDCGDHGYITILVLIFLI
jgi:hypothetical protein